MPVFNRPKQKAFLIHVFLISVYFPPTLAPLLFIHYCFPFLLSSQFNCAQSLAESLFLSCLFLSFFFVPHPNSLSVPLHPSCLFYAWKSSKWKKVCFSASSRFLPCCEDINTAKEMSKVKASPERQSLNSLGCFLSKEGCTPSWRHAMQVWNTPIDSSSICPPWYASALGSCTCYAEYPCYLKLNDMERDPSKPVYSGRVWDLLGPLMQEVI